MGLKIKNYNYEQTIIISKFPYGGGGNIYTFSVNGSKFSFELGMTWEEWINSEYNISGCWILNDRYYYSVMIVIPNIIYDFMLYLDTSRTEVKPTDFIIPEHDYFGARF